MSKMRICCRSKLLAVVYAFLLVFILSVGYIMISLSDSNFIPNDRSLESFNQLSNKQAFILHAEDMQRLQKSINVELGELERRRKELTDSISNLDAKNNKFSKQLVQLEIKVEQINTDISNMLLRREETLTNYSPLRLPLSLETVVQTPISSAPKRPCTVSMCFDYSRCSIMSNFHIYMYPASKQPESDLFIKWKSALSQSGLVTSFPESACMFIVINESSEGTDSLAELPHWLGDGRNHILIDTTEEVKSIEGSRAIIASSSYDAAVMQKEFDIPLPFISETPIDVFHLPLLLPVRRPKLLVFHGSAPQNNDISQLEKQFIEGLKSIHSETLEIALTLDCSSAGNKLEWNLCSDYDVSSIESTSMFTAIPNSEHMPYSQFILRLHTSLLHGSIPLIIGHHHPLPLSDVIKWSEAVVHLPLQRVTEAGYIIRNILEPDVFEYKKRGRYVLETYLSSYASVSATLLSLLRIRIGLPPTAPIIEESQLAYSSDNPMLTFEPIIEMSEEILGPLESPLPSPSYQRNFTSSVFTSGSMATGHQLSSYLYPNSPWDPVLPSDAKFHGSPYGFRPVNYGMGGSGTEFGRAIGGNNPTEQFTIVILTYNRLDQLLSQIAAFKNLPYLHKVLVVWNNPQPPDPAVKWPKIRAPIEVILSKKNSLNNRFIPYKEIETEAILSLDDDMYLRDFEIILAFRVWRENRDRIVGFPGRYHAWNLNDKQWNYNSNHSCELSMILTGAAFFHKYYSYQYTYHMAQAIRDKVDEFMNCEDLAMNFLVSSITDKPPIKTTSRWTFRCPTCGDVSLWLDESHLRERHECINYFIQVYGYLPLRYTQFRADSVLFKTRVPQDKSKCFVSV